jgi:hypothetical protein
MQEGRLMDRDKLKLAALSIAIIIFPDYAALALISGAAPSMTPDEED